MTISNVVFLSLLALYVAWLANSPFARRSMVKPTYSSADFLGWVLAWTAGQAVLGGEWSEATTGSQVWTVLVAISIACPIVLVGTWYGTKWWSVVADEDSNDDDRGDS